MEKLTNEIHRKIGRNLLLFQKVEGLLKYIVYFKNISSQNNHLSTQQRFPDLVKKKTMGILIDDLLNSKDNAENTQVLNLTFILEFSSDNYELKSKSLQILLEERNDLVHHLYIDTDWTSTIKCLSLNKQLDEQKSRILFEIQSLQDISKQIKRLTKQLLNEMTSGRLENTLELLIIERLLIEFSIQFIQKDGWTSLSIVGQHIQEKAPNEIIKVKEIFNYTSLTEIAIAAGIFDFKKEKSAQFYRLKLSS